MILKNKQSTRRKLPFVFKTKWMLIASGLAFFIAIISIIPKQSIQIDNQTVLYCDAEKVVISKKGKRFQGQGALFANAHTHSSEHARSGSFSSKTDAKNVYGMVYETREVYPGDRYKVSVWRHGNKLAVSNLVVSITKGEELLFFKQEKKATKADENEWEKVELHFTVPFDLDKGLMKIYPLGGSDPVYFDDMTIERLPKVRPNLGHLGIDTSLKQLDLRIDENNFRKLERRRNEVLNTGIYFAQERDWVKGKIHLETDAIPVKLRFKGDWMDHFRGHKWSFRIKVKEPHAWNQMLTFSIQRPGSRSFLDEWFYHYWLRREDVLTTRYDFLEVRINGNKKGIYAYEEHFTKQLVESRNRREGPIVKFSEDGVWNARKRWLDTEEGFVEIEENLNSFEASTVIPFQENKTLESEKLRNQFLVAQSLMQQYKFGQKPVNEVFDVEKLAKFYAITDLCQGYHSTIWHNQRFYFNPVINKLEPIGYDGFTADGIFSLGGKLFLGGEVHQLTQDFGEDLMRQHMLDPVFVDRYLFYVDLYSQKSYVNDVWEEAYPAILVRMTHLQEEFPDYHFDNKQLFDQANKLQRLIHPLKQNSIRAFKVSKTGISQKLRIANHHILPLEVIGSGTGKNNTMDTLVQAMWLQPKPRHLAADYQELSIPMGATKVYFRLPGTPKVYESQIHPWSNERVDIPSQVMTQAEPSCDICERSGKSIWVPKGSHTLTTDILIPKGYEFRIQAGTRIDFQKGAKLASFSPVFLNGTEEERIHLYSSDKSAGGFSVLQAPSASIMHYVHVEDFGTLDERNWTLTGALNFYESEVHLDHVGISKNHCEDALNIIRSPFFLHNSTVSQTFADGVDIDFCTGEIRNLSCFQTGNDAIDFSGSHVKIWDFHANETGDKGISVGEASEIVLYNGSIHRSPIGIAVKDLSRLEVNHIALEQCETGFTAYQKKPEFGGGRMIIRDYTAKDVKRLQMIERGSELILKGRRMEGI